MDEVTHWLWSSKLLATRVFFDTRCDKRGVDLSVHAHWLISCDWQVVGQFLSELTSLSSHVSSWFKMLLHVLVKFLFLFFIFKWSCPSLLLWAVLLKLLSELLNHLKSYSCIYRNLKKAQRKLTVAPRLWNKLPSTLDRHLHCPF